MYEISRRRFLQWSGALGGGLASSAILPLPSIAEDVKTVPSSKNTIQSNGQVVLSIVVVNALFVFLSKVGRLIILKPIIQVVMSLARTK